MRLFDAATRREWLPLGIVLALALALRVAASVAYRPALMWTDSWNYLYATTLPGGFTGEKTGNYALALRALRRVTDSLAVVTTLQHLAGLACGVVLYALLRRLGVPRALAALAIALVLLDAYAVALEQHVLAEAFFTFTLCLWAFVALAWRRSVPFVVLAGLLLAAAVTFRAVAVLVIPLWLVYCLWAYPDARRRAAGIAATMLAVLAYAGYHQATVGGFGLTQMSGWQLYSRTAEIGDCRGRRVPAEQRRLCPDPAADLRKWKGDSVAYNQYSPEAPPQKVFGDLYSLPPRRRLRANAELSRFGKAVVRAHPVQFARIVGHDFLRYLWPGSDATLPGYDDPINFPARARGIPRSARRAQQDYAPGYRPAAHRPAAALAEYRHWLHTPRWLLGPLLLAGLASLLAPLARLEAAHRPETFLLVGAGCALLVGGALNHYEPRYGVPAAPLLIAGGVLAGTDLWAARRRGRALDSGVTGSAGSGSAGSGSEGSGSAGSRSEGSCSEGS
jgi:hypothetical protein